MYRCTYCERVVPAGVPLRRHVIYKPGGRQILAENPACGSCLAGIADGVPVSALRPKLLPILPTRDSEEGIPESCPATERSEKIERDPPVRPREEVESPVSPEGGSTEPPRPKKRRSTKTRRYLTQEPAGDAVEVEPPAHVEPPPKVGRTVTRRGVISPRPPDDGK